MGRRSRTHTHGGGKGSGRGAYDMKEEDVWDPEDAEAKKDADKFFQEASDDDDSDAELAGDEEEVLALSADEGDSDEEEQEDDQHADARESDAGGDSSSGDDSDDISSDEDEGPSDDDLESRVSKRQWGKKLSAYYDTNDLHLEDERFGDSDEEHDAAAYEEADVREQRAVNLAKMDERDFEDEDLLMSEEEASEAASKKGKSKPSQKGPQKAVQAVDSSSLFGTDDTQAERLHKDAASFTRDEKLEKLRQDSPELEGMLDEFCERSDELEGELRPLRKELMNLRVYTKQMKRKRQRLYESSKEQTSSSSHAAAVLDVPRFPKCITAFDVRFHTTIVYLMQLAFYFSLKSKGADTKSHPVVNEIIRVQALLEEKLDPNRSQMISDLNAFIERRKAEKAAPKPENSVPHGRSHTEQESADVTGHMSSDLEDSESDMEPEPEKPSKRAKKKRKQAPSSSSTSPSDDPTFVDETNLLGDDFDASDSDDEEESHSSKKRKLGGADSDDEEDMSEPSDIDQVFDDFFGNMANGGGGADSDGENPAHGDRVHIGFGKKKAKKGGKSSSSGGGAPKSTAKNATKKKKNAPANVNEDALWDFYQSFAAKSEKTKNKKDAKKAKKDAAEAAKRAEEDAQLAAMGMSTDDPNARRKISAQISRNRGLQGSRSRKAKKTSRTKYRQKFKKTEAKYKSQRRSKVVQTGSYAGETTGIKSHLVRSKSLKK